ncbi:hypothetical protein BpHYR1_036909 [Brachionus plicatilis]|uniref:Uncharacterized protein n=1 Tax=Brachionus plicatilis TaxID=10195 RepID=A0A3M7RUR0_BRAPC|nr:hypothetical protein BpHYR1_036909 [Brachionus plicatilis]
MDLSLKLEASQAASYLDCACQAEACAGAQPRPVNAKTGFAGPIGAFFQLVLSSSKMVTFDLNLMHFCLMVKMADGEATSFLETVLCQKKEVLFCWISLMRSDWTGFWRFDVLFWLVECQRGLGYEQMYINKKSGSSESDSSDTLIQKTFTF